MSQTPRLRSLLLVVLVLLGAHLLGVPSSRPARRLSIILWFDTEDYVLPASDDAALRMWQTF